MIAYILGAMILYIVASRYFKDFNPGDKRVNSDIGQLKTFIEDYSKDLVPWDEREAELFAFNHTQKVKSVTFGKQIKGQFKSIYQEVILAYAYKEYPGNRGEKLLLIQTANHEMVYRIKKDVAQIYFDTQPLGSLGNGELLFEVGTKKVIGQLGAPENDMYPVIVGSRRIAYINDPKMMKGAVNPRAFNFLIPWDKEEERIFLALALYRIVTLHLPQK